MQHSNNTLLLTKLLAIELTFCRGILWVCIS